MNKTLPLQACGDVSRCLSHLYRPWAQEHGDWHKEGLFQPSSSEAVLSGSPCRHKHKSSRLCLVLSPFALPTSTLRVCVCGGGGVLCSRAWLWLLGVSPTSCFFVPLYQSAGSVFFWLIHVQSEVYYEPPGFNYYTIIQSIPCHFIFMAFIMPLYV